MSKTLLVITTSPLGTNSASNNVTAAFEEEYQRLHPEDKIKHLDLSSVDLPPFSASRVQAKFATWGGGAAPENVAEEWAATVALINEFKDADKYVIASPMWNFGIANRLKLYLDHIVQPWQTFDPTKSPGGLITGKPVLTIVASGMVPFQSDNDLATSYLQFVLSFIGFTDIRSVGVSGTATEKRAEVIENAIKEVREIAGKFEFDSSNNVVLPAAPPQPKRSSEHFSLGKKVLVIEASPLGEYSISTSITKGLTEEYKKLIPDVEIRTLQLPSANLPPFNADRVKAKFGSITEETQASWNATKEIVNDFKWADTYIFSTPTWNYALPNHLKLYLDHIVQPHLTFDGATGAGLVTGKPAFVIAAAGGNSLETSLDYVLPYLRAVLGFIGFSDLREVITNNTANMDERPSLIQKGIANAVALLTEATV